MEKKIKMRTKDQIISPKSLIFHEQRQLDADKKKVDLFFPENVGKLSKTKLLSNKT